MPFSKQWNLPFTVESLAEYGGLDFAWPPYEYDPRNAFDAVWQIWLLEPNPKKANHHGFIRLRKRPQGGNGFQLSVEQQVINQHGLDVQEAEIFCAQDAFATPLRWELHFGLSSFEQPRLPEKVAFGQSGSLRNGRLKIGKKETDLKGPVSSGWSWLEALQRNAQTGMETLPEFTMLDELVKIKENQKVRFLHEQTITVGGKPVPVRCYQKVGRGQLPILYYLDDAGRLLVALSGMRAYILNPNAVKMHKKQIKRLQRRGRRK